MEQKAYCIKGPVLYESINYSLHTYLATHDAVLLNKVIKFSANPVTSKSTKNFCVKTQIDGLCKCISMYSDVVSRVFIR